MNEQTNYPNWTDEQWRRVTDLVATEADKARVGARYLPLYGPVDPSVVAVPDYLLGNRPNPKYAQLRASNKLTVDSSPNTYLATITIQIPLANHEVAEPELQAAAVAFRRAAVTIARVEDALIFNGQMTPGRVPWPTLPGGWAGRLPPVFALVGGASQAGLVPTGALPNQPPPLLNIAPRVDVPLPLPAPLPWAPADRQKNMAAWSEIIVRVISDTVGKLEANGHAGPFACFLSPDVFEAVHTPSPAMVLPRDRILPFLGGDYLSRSNAIPNGYGIVVAGVPAYETDTYGKRQKQSGGGGPVEIVVATDISLRYLQQTPEPKFLFRVWEKVALRVKEWDAVAVLRPGDDDSSLPPLEVQTGKPVPPTVESVKETAEEGIARITAKIEQFRSDLATHDAKMVDEDRHHASKLEKVRSDDEKIRALIEEKKKRDYEHGVTIQNLNANVRQLINEKNLLQEQLDSLDELLENSAD
jgi:hypothetical protein